MMEISDNDILLIKYMILSTGIFSNKNELISLKSIYDIKEKLKDHKEIDTVPILSEALYFVGCYNALHVNNDCYKIYEGNPRGLNISEQIVLFVRLFQDLEEDEFADVLQICVNETMERFRELKINFTEMDLNDFKDKILQWLAEHQPNLSHKYRTICGPMAEFDLIEDHGTQQVQGLCVIINNEYFTDPKYKRREGTSKDEENLFQAFTKLGYDIRVFNNVKHDEMLTTLSDASDSFKRSHRKLLLFVLSHGVEKGFITSDGKLFRFDETVVKFKDNEYLKGKHRLFFFVCCRGDKRDRGTYVQTDGGVPDASESIVPDDEVIRNIEYDCGTLTPACASVFEGYASYMSHRSLRCPINGTLFVRGLCHEIKKDPRRNITAIFDDVRDYVRDESINSNFENESDRIFQIPVSKNNLTGVCPLWEDLNGPPGRE